MLNSSSLGANLQSQASQISPKPRPEELSESQLNRLGDRREGEAPASGGREEHLLKGHLPVPGPRSPEEPGHGASIPGSALIPSPHDARLIKGLCFVLSSAPVCCGPRKEQGDEVELGLNQRGPSCASSRKCELRDRSEVRSIATGTSRRHVPSAQSFVSGALHLSSREARRNGAEPLFCERSLMKFAIIKKAREKHLGPVRGIQAGSSLESGEKWKLLSGRMFASEGGTGEGVDRQS
ncbi:hypothetical protein AAFF_G00000210 [Aldrovandia affinis]|uniref:Uncharacterized protein n=1 Tax=Aldrovandia affinis TaxID=143900 RepID=A0AAD7TD98_9TELE|nr:hypothetical protein AAFF_G00000210 [Aldrovandia affinis]